MEKETFINAVLSSTLTTRNTVPAGDLLNKIERKIKEEQVSFQWSLPLVATVALLVILNLAYLNRYLVKQNQWKHSTAQYALFTTNQLYSHDKN
jgi:hypothetical protein